jgi:hypothetical protein
MSVLLHLYGSDVSIFSFSGMISEVECRTNTSTYGAFLQSRHGCAPRMRVGE